MAGGRKVIVYYEETSIVPEKAFTKSKDKNEITADEKVHAFARKLRANDNNVKLFETDEGGILAQACYPGMAPAEWERMDAFNAPVIGTGSDQGQTFFSTTTAPTRRLSGVQRDIAKATLKKNRHAHALFNRVGSRDIEAGRAAAQKFLQSKHGRKIAQDLHGRKLLFGEMNIPIKSDEEILVWFADITPGFWAYNFHQYLKNIELPELRAATTTIESRRCEAYRQYGVSKTEASNEVFGAEFEMETNEKELPHGYKGFKPYHGTYERRVRDDDDEGIFFRSKRTN